MLLTQWAERWGIPPQAMSDLYASLHIAHDPSSLFRQRIAEPTTERGVQDRERLIMSTRGGHLWRNNTGAFQDTEGRWIRYGLCNDSKRMNSVVKSSDLIGIRPVKIGREHLGRVVGQFVAREVKSPGWKYTGTEREAAQAAFIARVVAAGGDAGFVS